MDTNPFAEVMMQVSETLKIVVDTVVGHRKQLIDADFGKDAAEQMCVELHRILLISSFGGKVY